MGHLEYHKSSNRIYSELGGHCHSVYEIYYFVCGNAEIMIEGKIHPLTPHSLLVIPPNVFHGIRVNTRNDYIRCCMYVGHNDIIPERKHLLSAIMPDTKKKASQELLYEHIESYRLEQFFYNLKQLENQPEEIQKTLEPIFIEALAAQIYLLSNTMRPSKINKAPSKIVEIVSYLNEHLTEDLSLESISDHFFISKNYLNRTFKETIGTTVMDYIRSKRVALARQMIKDGESATSAAIQVGFADYSAFYRACKKYTKFAPSEFSTL